MTPWLPVVTILALAAAAAFGWLAWRLHADERRRSAARVAALAHAIDRDDAPSHPAGPRVPVQSLFVEEHSAAARGTPAIKVAAALVMGLALAAALALGGREPASTGDAAAGGVNTVATGRGAAPLELISMRHERDGGTLTVSGLVRNPRAGSQVAGVSAVIFVFNRAGAFVTSARASLDFPRLEPGDESPFVVTIPGMADVGRYRVSFRTQAGVVRHVDRRAEQLRLAALER